MSEAKEVVEYKIQENLVQQLIAALQMAEPSSVGLISDYQRLIGGLMKLQKV
jgi:hypothetical protein